MWSGSHHVHYTIKNEWVTPLNISIIDKVRGHCVCPKCVYLSVLLYRKRSHHCHLLHGAGGLREALSSRHTVVALLQGGEALLLLRKTEMQSKSESSRPDTPIWKYRKSAAEQTPTLLFLKLICIHIKALHGGAHNFDLGNDIRWVFYIDINR